MEFRRQEVKVEILDPRRGFEPAISRLEVRWDPLTGHTSRLIPPSGLLPRSDFDLAALAKETAPTCPFCSPRIEEAVPRFPPAILPEGRVRVGEAVLFPNLLPYSQYSTVSVYSPDRHYLPLSAMTPRLVADNLTTQVLFDRAVGAADPAAGWASINANHMLPSGSSVFHPHFQGGVNPTPTNMQRQLADVPPERFAAYLEAERKAGERLLGEIGGTLWLAAFAPVGFAELRAFVPGVASPAELTPDLVEDLGEGIATALNFYAELGLESFNMGLYGAPPGTPGYVLNLRLVCRSNLEPLYRSDIAWLDKVHWEPAVDISPEDLAQRAGSRFRR
jgi:galactose-1-phosphate uridylyltransferase